jgi:SAM-dependent methyltransferase
MNKNDPVAGPPSAAPPETLGKTGPLAEATQGRDPTLKWCVPDPAGNPALPPAPRPPASDPALDEKTPVTHEASGLPAALAGRAIKGALPEAIQESTHDTFSPRSDSVEIIVADGSAEDGEPEPLGKPEATAAATPPPKPAMDAVTPPPKAEAVTPPPRAATEAVTPPPKAEAITPPPRVVTEAVSALQPKAEAVTAPPRAVMEAITAPPRAATEAVTQPPTQEAVPAPAPPEKVAAPLPRLSLKGGTLAAPAQGAAPPRLQASSTTGAMPEAPIRIAETAEVGDGEFEVMELGDQPSPSSSTAPTTPPPVPVPGMPGAPTTTLQPPGSQAPSDTGGAVAGGAVAALAREALSLPEALSRRPLKKRLKPWFEEVFDENYLRTLPFMTAQQTLRETAFIENALALPPEGELLDIACGYGRHAIELGQRGFHVTGLDLSLPLLIRAADEAQRRGLTVNFVHADMREMTYDSQFAAAYCVLTSFGYFDEETNLRVASSICRALKPGGRFLVDTINRDYIVSDLPSRVWWEGDGCVVLEEVDFDFHTSRVVIRRSIVFGDGRQVENEISIRAYSLHEMGRVLRRAGFQVVDVSGSLSQKEPFLGAASRHVVIICERPTT